MESTLKRASSFSRMGALSSLPMAYRKSVLVTRRKHLSYGASAGLAEDANRGSTSAGDNNPIQLIIIGFID